jgi:hypothetical protein
MIKGKGFFTWKIPRCENGDPYAIAAEAKSANFSHVLIKVADGTTTYNGSWGIDEDFITPVVDVLKSQGIQVWGWHYIYGYNPIGEVNKAIQRTAVMSWMVISRCRKRIPGRWKASGCQAFCWILRSAFRTYPLD